MDSIQSRARDLRKNLTDAERKLWKYLRAKQLGGLKFRRQEPIGKYIVDFVCYERQLVIEVDGGQHSEERSKDEERDQWLKAEGFRVLRFWNHEVLENTEVVLEIIRQNISPSPPSPPTRGGEKKLGEGIGEKEADDGENNFLCAGSYRV